MAGFKRGGPRGGGGSAYKKSYAKKRAASDDEDGAPRAGKKTRGDDDEEEESTPVVPELKTNDDGDKYIGLSASGKRRITVREFKSSLLLDIREYWTNDGGELKPGKKGISLNLDQYNTLVAAMPLIEAALAEKKATAVRPDYDAAPAAATTSKGEDVENIPEESPAKEVEEEEEDGDEEQDE